MYDYDLIKRCCTCGNISLNSFFQKNKKKSDGFNPQCEFCRKKYKVDNQDRLMNKQKFYNEQNRDQTIGYQLKNHDEFIARKKIHFINRSKTDNNFRLISKTRSRVRKALNGKLKSSSTKQVYV